MPSVNIPLGKTDFRRTVANEPDIPVLNRYFEHNPTNLEDQVALLARPGLKRWIEIGEGPIRLVASQPGSFSDSLFVVSYDTLYRINSDETSTEVGDGIFGYAQDSTPSVAITAAIGATPEFLFCADGQTLRCYTDNSRARNVLEASSVISDGDKISIDSTYYQWTSGSVDSGSPDGSSGSPWLVAVGGDTTESLENMASAINNDGLSGEQYSSAIIKNTKVSAPASDNSSLRIRALDFGVVGNAIGTTVVVGANIAWDDTTLTNGGNPLFFDVPMPDDVPPKSVAFIAGYVIVVVDGGYGVNGRFYWINPGETEIDPLNYATAERAPDPVISVRAVGDQFWLLGTNSTEVWYPTGDGNTPFARVQGRLFDRGVWEGSDAQIKDDVILVDPQGIVYRIGSNGIQRISNNSVEETLRRAINTAKGAL